MDMACRLVGWLTLLSVILGDSCFHEAEVQTTTDQRPEGAKAERIYLPCTNTKPLLDPAPVQVSDWSHCRHQWRMWLASGASPATGP